MQKFISELMIIMPCAIIIIWGVGLITNPEYNKKYREIKGFNVFINSIFFIVSFLVTLALYVLNQKTSDIFTTLSLLGIIITSIETAKCFICSVLGVIISKLIYKLVHEKNDDMYF